MGFAAANLSRRYFEHGSPIVSGPSLHSQPFSLRLLKELLDRTSLIWLKICLLHQPLITCPAAYLVTWLMVVLTQVDGCGILVYRQLTKQESTVWTSGINPQMTRKERIERAATQILAAMVGPTSGDAMFYTQTIQSYIDMAMTFATQLIQKIDEADIMENES